MSGSGSTSTIIKNDFSIENILSKPDRSAALSENFLARSNLEMSSFERPGSNSNHFATPDSSCCGEDNADALSDVAPEEGASSKCKVIDVSKGRRDHSTLGTVA